MIIILYQNVVAEGQEGGDEIYLFRGVPYKSLEKAIAFYEFPTIVKTISSKSIHEVGLVRNPFFSRRKRLTSLSKMTPDISPIFLNILIQVSRRP